MGRAAQDAVLGIDVGTTAVKAIVYSAGGLVLGTGRADAPPHRSGSDPLAAAQDMEQLWSAVTVVVREAVSAAGDGVSVVGVGVTGQGDGCWLVDGGGDPVGTATLWLDGRAGDRVRTWERDGGADAVRRTTGSSPFAGALPVLLEELAARDPERLARARHQLNCKDWVRFRMTGVMATDPSEASRTYLDVRTGQYSDELLDALGHRRFAHLLPEVVGSDEVAGRLRPEPARRLGLSPGVPVVTGLVDTVAVGAGLGAAAPGSSYAIVGTTGFVGVVRPAPTLGIGTAAITLRTGTGDDVVECLAPMSGTPNLDWARRVLDLGDRDERGAAEAAAAAVAPGAGGVMYLPYAAGGERAPFVDPDASGAWLGTDATTSPAQLLRAAYEGLAMAMRECMDVLDTPGPVRLGGGGAGSSLLPALLADVTGREVHIARTDEAGTRGVAALAMRQAGLPRWPEPTFRRYVPDPDAAGHDARFATFVAVRDALRPHWAALGRRADRHEAEHTSRAAPPGDSPAGERVAPAPV